MHWTAQGCGAGALPAAGAEVWRTTGNPLPLCRRRP